MNVLIVFDHPRRDSLYGAVLDNLLAGLHLLFDVLEDPEARRRHLATARQLGESYFGRADESKL